VGSQIEGTRSRPGELREHPSVELVGLAGQRGEALGLLCVGDLDVPAVQLQVSWTNRAPFIDSITAWTGPPSNLHLLDKVPQPVRVRRAQRGGETSPVVRQDTDVQSLPAQVQACNIVSGASFVGWFR